MNFDNWNYDTGPMFSADHKVEFSITATTNPFSDQKSIAQLHTHYVKLGVLPENINIQIYHPFGEL